MVGWSPSGERAQPFAIPYRLGVQLSACGCWVRWDASGQCDGTYPCSPKLHFSGHLNVQPPHPLGWLLASGSEGSLGQCIDQTIPFATRRWLEKPGNVKRQRDLRILGVETDQTARSSPLFHCRSQSLPGKLPI